MLVGLRQDGRNHLWEYYRRVVKRCPAFGQHVKVPFNDSSYIGQLHVVLCMAGSSDYLALMTVSTMMLSSKTRSEIRSKEITSRPASAISTVGSVASMASVCAHRMIASDVKLSRKVKKDTVDCLCCLLATHLVSARPEPICRSNCRIKGVTIAPCAKPTPSIPCKTDTLDYEACRLSASIPGVLS